MEPLADPLVPRSGSAAIQRLSFQQLLVRLANYHTAKVAETCRNGKATAYGFEGGAESDACP